ncbi:hypothetical protein AAG906_020301 [Vitis piasezkii]
MRSLRVALEQHVSEAEWVQSRYDQLSLLDEKRLRVADHAQAYQRKMTHAFRKRVRPRKFQRVSITWDIEGHILSFHSFTCLGPVIEMMIQLGPLRHLYSIIPFHLAMLWASEFELGHNSFLSPLVTLVSYSCRGIPFAFHLCLISGLFESFVGNPESHIGAYPFVIKASRALVFASLLLLVRWFLGIAPEFDPLLRYSPGFYHFPVLARTLLDACSRHFWYSPRTLLTCPEPSPDLPDPSHSRSFLLAEPFSQTWDPS